MRLRDELRSTGRLFGGLTFYERFEHAVVLVLTVLIVGVVRRLLAGPRSGSARGSGRSRRQD